MADNFFKELKGKDIYGNALQDVLKHHNRETGNMRESENSLKTRQLYEGRAKGDPKAAED